MTDLQIVLLLLSIPAALYQFLKIVQIGALVSHYGGVKVGAGLWVAFLITLGIEAAFVLAMTGRIE